MRTIHGIRWNSVPFRLFSLTLIVFSISFASFVSIRAQSSAPVDTDNQSEDITVARISLIHGILSMMRGDDPDWFDINVNMPVQTGDRLYANDDGRAELQLGSNFFVRLNSKTGMDILELSSERAQLRMFSGSLVINLRRQPKQNVEIDTPSGAVTLSEAGEFRINVVSDIKTEVIVWRGDANVFSEKDIVVRTGQRLILITGEYPSAEITDMLAADNWDKWNQQRDYQLSKEAQSLDYIADNQSVEGAEDLSEYGNWTNTEEYGEVWTPSDVDSDWAPYQDGGWIWRDPCGWTWVSSEPWGWAPYHYGRWTVIGGRWCWVPGSDRHYSPAVVGFLNHGTKGVIGWVPLAPGDRYSPSRAKGHALDSKGVPYINQKFRNGTSIATRDGFAGGKSYRHGGPNSEPGLGTGRVVAAPPVVPTKASLATNSGGRTAPVRPTPSYFNRTVVARNNDVPVVRSFTDKVAEIKANGGAPVSAVKLTPSGARATRQLIPENSPTRQIAGGTSSPVPQPLRSGNATGAQQTNTNQPRNGGLNTRSNSPQRQGGAQENQGTGQESQGNVYRSQAGVDQRQNNPQPGQVQVQGNIQQPLTQKPQTPPSQSESNVNRPPAAGRTTGREVERSSDNNKQQSPQQQPEPSRPQKPQTPDQQEQRRQQQQERDLQLQQQREQESQRQQREREQQQQQEQDRQAQQQKEQESQRQQREREQQQQEQDRQAQQQKEQEDQRQQREREQQQEEQDRQAQQQRDQENQRQQRDRDQQQETARRQQQGEQERQRQQADRQRQQQADQDRQRQQQAEQEQQRQQQADQERQRQQQAEQERQRQQQADQERQRQQQADQERQQQQQAEQERQRQQQAEQERQRQQQADQERQRQQQAEQERQQQQQAEQERQRQQQAEQERQRQQQEQQRQQQEQERQRQQQPVKKDPPGSNR